MGTGESFLLFVEILLDLVRSVHSLLEILNMLHFLFLKCFHGLLSLLHSIKSNLQFLIIVSLSHLLLDMFSKLSFNLGSHLHLFHLIHRFLGTYSDLLLLFNTFLHLDISLDLDVCDMIGLNIFSFKIGHLPVQLMTFLLELDDPGFDEHFSIFVNFIFVEGLVQALLVLCHRQALG